MKFLNIFQLKVPTDRASLSASSLVDENFQFAPYLGGGGCYDYDAIFLISNSTNISNFKSILSGTLQSIYNSQNADGGFCESHL